MAATLMLDDMNTPATSAIVAVSTPVEPVRTPSPWMSLREAAAYTQRSTKFLSREVRRQRLRAAVVGGRRELMFKAAWLDAYLEELSTPVLVGVRSRRA